MDAAVFEQVYGAFGDFHAYFAPGRREKRDHSRHYLQALLVQSGERRNAENLSETVPASARVMQRFLAESPWDDSAVIGRLQEYLGPRLRHPCGVGAGRQRLPKAGQEVGGMARQYCGRPRWELPSRNVPGLCQPVGTGPGGRLYLPESWTSDKDRWQQGFRRRGRATGRRPNWRWRLQLAVEQGDLKARLGCGDDAFGMSPSFREGLAALGMRYVLDVPAGFTVWPPEPERHSGIPGPGGGKPTGGRAAAHYGGAR